MFEIGAILLAAAQNYAMLILGRVFLGVAVGFACTSVANGFSNTCVQPHHYMPSVHLHGELAHACTPCQRMRHAVNAQISFASVSVPMYNAEMAPPQLRGRLNQLYQVWHLRQCLLAVLACRMLLSSQQPG
jgi:MFS family permease